MQVSRTSILRADCTRIRNAAIPWPRNLRVPVSNVPLTMVGTSSFFILRVILLAWPVSARFHENTTANTCKVVCKRQQSSWHYTNSIALHRHKKQKQSGKLKACHG